MLAASSNVCAPSEEIPSSSPKGFEGPFPKSRIEMGRRITLFLKKVISFLLFLLIQACTPNLKALEIHRLEMDIELSVHILPQIAGVVCQVLPRMTSSDQRPSNYGTQMEFRILQLMS